MAKLASALVEVAFGDARPDPKADSKADVKIARSHIVGTRILSAVCVVDGRCPDNLTAIADLHAVMSALRSPIEVVVVVVGAEPSFLSSFREFVERLSHTQVYVMSRRIDYATALLAGIENSIGDWVATIDLESDEPDVIRRLFESAIRDHAEVVLGSAPSLRRGPVDAVLSGLFHRMFRTLHGFTLSSEAPTSRLFSRAVVNSLLRHDSPLVALETLTANGGYRKTLVPYVKRKGSRPPLSERIYARWRLLIGINAMPLRIANLLCGMGALSALGYSVYVVIVYLIKDNVVPGWTTVSIMLSVMFLMLSLVLWLLSEYMIMLLDAGARRPRYEIADEFGSQLRALQNTLNVETEL